MTPWYLSTKGVLEAAIGSSSFNCSVIVSHNIFSYFIEIHQISLNQIKSQLLCSLNSLLSLVKPPFLIVQPSFLLVESPLVTCPVPPPLAACRLSLLLAAIHGSKGSMASGGLGVLTTHANAWDRGTGFSMFFPWLPQQNTVQMLFEHMEKCPKADLKLGFLNSSPILC